MAMPRPAFMLLYLAYLLIPGLTFSQSAARTENLIRILDTLTQREEFSGIVLYAKRNRILLERAHGRMAAEDSAPITRHAAFNLASLTKQFMGVLTLKLMDSYSFGPEDFVQSYLSDFPDARTQIKHLLTHTSGLPDYFAWAENLSGPLDTLSNQEVYRYVLTNYQVPYAPGERYQYSNTGYIVLSILLEKITGRSIYQLLDQYLIQPYRLEGTRPYTIDFPIPFPERVQGFKKENGKLRPNDLYRVDGVFGDGNLYASAQDLYRWTEHWRSGKLLSKQSRETGYQPFFLPDGSKIPYGYGLQIDTPDLQFSHTGSWVGFHHFIAFHERTGETIIVLTNNSNPTTSRLIQRWFNHLPAIQEPSQLIQNVRILDGTGLPERQESLRIRGERIYETGNLKPYPGELVTEGMGWVLAPGFIDAHSHHEGYLEEKPEALPVVSQGITTLCIGQDGFSIPMDTLLARYSRTRPAVNLLSYTGHASLRVDQMGLGGLFRTASAKELEGMRVKLIRELDAGSFGLSTGLEYEQGFYSNRDEVMTLAAQVAAKGARYMSHIRSEDIQLEEALDEIIRIGEVHRLPVQISHLKIAQKSKWGSAHTIIRKLQEARQRGVRISADVYPYTYWQSTLRVLYPNRDYTNPAASIFATEELFDPKESILLRYAPQPAYAGKTIEEIASMRASTSAETLQYLVAEASRFEEENPDFQGSIEGIMAKSMSEADLSVFLAWPHSQVCSDGGFTGHPRGRGAFPRVLANYVRETGLLTLANAIHKMTGATAENLGLRDRGLIAPGYFADLVLFDPDIVKDHATPANPQALSEGMKQVWVNGVSVFKAGKAELSYPGKVLVREK